MRTLYVKDAPTSEPKIVGINTPYKRLLDDRLLTMMIDMGFYVP